MGWMGSFLLVPNFPSSYLFSYHMSSFSSMGSAMYWSLLLLFTLNIASTQGVRQFYIDYGGHQFIRDGQPFRYISGSMHYFRTLPDQWENRIATARAAGLNALEVYIPWNFHETYQGKYDFSGWRNFTHFFELAAAHDLGIILRPGPYICGEWENGGLPYWLLKYPGIKLRSSQTDFLREALNWWNVLLPMVKPYLWNNGGPVMMVQIENEYGSYGCDKEYLTSLRDNAYTNLGLDVTLFTTDPPKDIQCGQIEGVYATVDFGETDEHQAREYFDVEKKANPTGGPLVNSEYYPGWFQTWGTKSLTNPTPKEVHAMTQTLWKLDSSFNYYMFHGGTNFEFWNGAEYDAGLITSYDYFAPMMESGKAGPKYLQIQKYISDLKDWDNKPLAIPATTPTIKFGMAVSKYGNLFDFEAITINQNTCKTGPTAITFEQLDQPFGFVKYSTKVTVAGSVLNGTGIRDFGYVYVNQVFKGRIASHFKKATVLTVRIDVKPGDQLDIYVENQGRLTWLTEFDPKGIISPLSLDSKPITSQWTSCPINITALPANIYQASNAAFKQGDFFSNQFRLTTIGDTYFDTTNWGKGVVWINGFNIGRFWGTEGPQRTMYIPASILQNNNRIVILELEKLSSDCLGTTNNYCTLNFLDAPLPPFNVS